MSSVNSILNLGLSLQAVALLGKNVEAVKNKNKLKGITSAAVTNLIGIPLLQAQARIIGGIK